MKHYFIINPNAGRGKALEIKTKIEQYFSGRSDYQICLTTRAKEATELARKYAFEGSNRIYAVGGDGTLNEVLNGVVNSPSSLGLIPAGTGNDFAKYAFNDQPKTIQEIIEAPIQSIDVGECNGQYFINIASIGIDADVCFQVEAFKKKRWIPDHLKYMTTVLFVLKNFKGHRVMVDGQEKDITLIAFANGKYYGGGVKIAPNAHVNDGLFDVCVAKKVSKYSITQLLPKMKNAGHVNHPAVSFYQTNETIVESDIEMIVQLDGELLFTNKACFKLHEKHLNWIGTIH